jgi:APA family basic amino acid/polyamine antiporter
VIAALDIVTQSLLIGLGFAFLFSTNALSQGTSLGTSPTWHQIAFALPVAMLAYTGLESVANLAEEVRRPGRDLPRSLFAGIGIVVVFYVLIALVALSALPAHNGESALGTSWKFAPLLGIVAQLHAHIPDWGQSIVRYYVGLTAALILFLSIVTSMSGFGRLAYSLGEHGQLPPAFGRLNRRTLTSRAATVMSTVVASALIIITSFLSSPIAFLASLFSFGALFAFTAAQLAVVALRVKQPGLRRPFRVPFNVTIRGASIPIPSVVGALLTFAVFIAAMATHEGARYGGPVWLLAGAVIYFDVRRRRGVGLLEHVKSADEQVLPEAAFRSILVPMKLGEIGEEMIATAIKLAQERQSAVEALHVIKVPLDQPLDAELGAQETRARESLEEAKLLGEENGVEVRGETVRARSIGEAIVGEASKRNADLIVLGSAPRWRRQSRFFSPTVEYVLRHAPCEVLIVAFPQGVLEEEHAPA